MANNRPKHVVDYFRRGEVLFLVDGTLAQAFTDTLFEWAGEIAAERGLTIENPRTLQFPHISELPEPDGIDLTIFLSKRSERQRPPIAPDVNETGPFGLVSAEVPALAGIPASDPEDPSNLPTILRQNASELLNLIRSLDRARTDERLAGRLQVVSPNWLASSGGDSQPGSTGGPGAKPMAADGPANTQEFEFILPQEIMDEIEDGRGENVVVAILDTAPKKDGALPALWEIHHINDSNSVLGKIYDKWVTQRSIPIMDPPDPHSLISRLLPRLTVYLHPEIDRIIPTIEPAGYMQADGHDYEMTDHGLFVAGIIHSLAPQAELHLFQVLNRYGVGDLRTFAEALKVVHDRFWFRDLVVNASLTFGPPIVKEHSKDEDDDNDNDNDDEAGRAILRLKDEEKEDKGSWSNRQDLIAKRISNLSYTIGTRVVAAAGNNRKKKKDSPRPQACYPAALDSVLGVGALPKGEKPQNSNRKLKTTSYSNRSDRPAHTGITTLGGEEGKGAGILGIYTEGFPRNEEPPEHNPATDPSLNGWGWWAGTSFATPIISGITAAVLSNIPGSTTQQAIEKLLEAQDYQTDANEDVLFVTQGP